jgi:hypothetical protein
MLVTRLRMLGPAACCALALVATLAAGAARADQPQPDVLWNAFPLDPATGGQANGSQHATTADVRSPSSTAQGRSSTAPKRSSVLKIVVVVAAVVVGIVIGLIPALILGAFLGVVPRPRLVRPRRRAPPAPARSGPARTQPLDTRVVFDPRPPEPEPAALRTLVPAQVHAALPAPVDDELVSARDRHRELYDAAYADQLYRIQTLRRTISAGLAISTASMPMDDAPPVTECDE